MALEHSNKEDIIKDSDDLQLSANLSFDKKSTTYSEETEIINYITGKFKSIEDNITNYNTLIKYANNYLTTNNEISSTAISSLGTTSGTNTANVGSVASNAGYNGSQSDDEYEGREPEGDNYGDEEREPEGDNYGDEEREPEGDNYGDEEREPEGDNYGDEEREPEGDNPDPPNAVVTTKGGRLNVRSGPGANNSVVTKLKNGSKIVVLEKGTKWSKIAYTGTDGKEKYGYVATKYLKEISNVEIPATPKYIAGKVATPQGGRLNIRSGPGTGNTVIGKIKNDTSIQIVKKGNTWTKIVFKDKNGNDIYGYVATKYIKS